MVAALASEEPFTRLVRDPSRFRATLARARYYGPIANPAIAADVMMPTAEVEDQEVAWTMALDTHGFLRGIAEVARGGRAWVGMDLPDVLRPAERAGARYLILFHNHPSGDASPSGADSELTGAVADAANASGLYLLDHVVLGMDEAFSFRWGARWRIK